MYVQMLQAHQLGKRDKWEGKHTEGDWTPGKRKRGLAWWTPKRTELGAWRRLSKRIPESSFYQGPPVTSSDPRIRMLRGSSNDLNQRNRIIKREADESGSLIRIIRRGINDVNQWERIVKRRQVRERRQRNWKKNFYGRLNKRQEPESEAGWMLLTKRPAGTLVKWGRRLGRIQKRYNKDIETDEDEEDEENEELEENAEECVDNCAENHEKEFSNEIDGIDLDYEVL